MLVGSGVSVGNGVLDGTVTVAVGVSAATVSTADEVAAAVTEGALSGVGDNVTSGSSGSDNGIRPITANEIRAKTRKKIPRVIFTSMV